MVHQINLQIMSISGWMSFTFLANCWVGTAGQNQNINDLLEFSQQFGKPAAEWDSGPQFFDSSNYSIVSVMFSEAPGILAIGVHYQQTNIVSRERISLCISHTHNRNNIGYLKK